MRTESIVGSRELNRSMAGHKLKRNYGLIFFVSFIFFIFSLAFRSVYYESNDDDAMNLIAAGAYGEQYRPYLIFTNICYGYFLRGLYFINGNVNWYFWAAVICSFLAVCMICAACAENCDMPACLIITGMINFCLSYEYYNAIQFTKNAYLYSGAGLLFLYHLMKSKSRNIFGYMLGIMCALLGYMIRRNCFAVALLFAGILIASVFWEDYKLLFGMNIKQFFKTQKFNGAVLLCMALLIFVVEAVHLYAYYSDAEWKYYMEYNAARGEILDYGLPSYSEYQEQYEALGMDEIDVQLLEKWDYSDPNKFTLDTMKGIVEMSRLTGRHSLRVDWETVSFTCHAVMQRITGSILGFSWIVLIMIILLMKDQRLAVLAGLLSVLIMAEYWYLSCRGRVIWRAEIGLWLVPCIFILSELAGLIKIGREVSGNKNYLLYAAWICLLLVNFVSMGYEFAEQKDMKIAADLDNYGDFISFTKEGEECFYLGDTLSFNGRRFIKNTYDVDEKYHEYFSNFAGLGGWMIPSPAGLHFQKEFGIENPMAALYLDDNVYFADNEERADLVLAYLKKEYNGNIEMKKVNEIGELTVWKYYCAE